MGAAVAIALFARMRSKSMGEIMLQKKNFAIGQIARRAVFVTVIKTLLNVIIKIFHFEFSIHFV
jgi:hypothetical protein